MGGRSEVDSRATVTSANKYSSWIVPLPLRLSLLGFPLPSIVLLVVAPLGFLLAPGIAAGVTTCVPLDAPVPFYVPDQLLRAFLALRKLVSRELVAGYEQVHVVVALAPAFAPGVAVDRPAVWVLPSLPVVGPLPGEVAEVLVRKALAVLWRDDDVYVLGGPGTAVLGEVLALLFGPLSLVVAAAVGLLDEALLVSGVLYLAPFALAGGLFALLALLGSPRDVAGAAGSALRTPRGVGVGDVVDVGVQAADLTAKASPGKGLTRESWRPLASCAFCRSP